MNISNGFQINLTYNDRTYSASLEQQGNSDVGITLGGETYALVADPEHKTLFLSLLNSALHTPLPPAHTPNERSSLLQNRLNSLQNVKHAMVSSITTKVDTVGTKSLGQSRSRGPIASFTQFASKLESSSGTRFHIQQLLEEISIKESMPQLLELAIHLAEHGDLKKASNLFFYLQSELPPDARIDHFMRLGNAFYRRGIAKGDVQALDCAEFHFCMTRLSDYPDVRQKGEAMIQTIHQNLQKIARTGNEEQKRSARNLLDQIRISDLLDPYSAPVSAAEAEKLQLQEPNVREAFALAKDYQRRIDAIDAPKPFHIGSRIVKVPDGKGTLSMHAVVTGTRQEQGGKKEPVVILEPGLGCISSDWQLLQRSLPSDIAAISYDREGLGWSEKGAGQIASPERSMELLRSLLKEQGFSPPYVFVGHSYGGFLGQLFALNYPEEVAGLVLVDSALEDVAPIPNPPPESIFDYLPQASRARFVQNDRGDFLDAVEGYAVGAITGRTEQATTFEEEFGKALPHASDLLLAALSKNPKPFAMPVKVISAGIYLPDPRKSAAENAAAEQHWKAGQEKLKGRSSSLHSTHIVAPNSDHFIMYYDYNMIKDQIVSFYPRLGDNKGQS